MLAMRRVLYPARPIIRNTLQQIKLSKSYTNYFQNLNKRDIGLVGLGVVGDFGAGVIGVSRVVLM